MRLTPRRVLTMSVSALVAASIVSAPGAGADPLPSAAGWTATGNLAVPRDRAAAVLLNNGNVLMMGGQDCGPLSCTYFATSEIYNPATGLWSAGPSMSTSRTDFKAVVLGNGKVLAIGGTNGSGNQTADLYNPATNTFGSAGSFSLDMDSGFSAVVLNSGRVLVVGGCCGGAPYNQTSVLYNPATNSWSNGPSLSVPRYAPTATLLPNGKVLVAGGIDSGGTVLSSTELYNPGTNTFSPGDTLFDGRWSAQAALMPDGRVLIAGGVSTSGCFGGSEVYNPATNTFTNRKLGLPPRSDQTATPVLTNNGKLLLAGGNCSLNSAGLYNFGTNTWQSTPGLDQGRRDQVLIRLRSGEILAAGGDTFSDTLASAELYTPETTASAYATPNPVPRGTVVTIAGSGFTAGETVRLSNNGRPFANATANAAGRFSVAVNTSAFPVRTYIDKAEGLISGRIAYFSAPIVAS